LHADDLIPLWSFRKIYRSSTRLPGVSFQEVVECGGRAVLPCPLFDRLMHNLQGLEADLKPKSACQLALDSKCQLLEKHFNHPDKNRVPASAPADALSLPRLV